MNMTRRGFLKATAALLGVAVARPLEALAPAVDVLPEIAAWPRVVAWSVTQPGVYTLSYFARLKAPDAKWVRYCMVQEVADRGIVECVLPPDIAKNGVICGVQLEQAPTRHVSYVPTAGVQGVALKYVSNKRASDAELQRMTSDSDDWGGGIWCEEGFPSMSFTPRRRVIHDQGLRLSFAGGLSSNADGEFRFAGNGVNVISAMHMGPEEVDRTVYLRPRAMPA